MHRSLYKRMCRDPEVFPNTASWFVKRRVQGRGEFELLSLGMTLPLSLGDDWSLCPGLVIWVMQCNIHTESTLPKRQVGGP